MKRLVDLVKIARLDNLIRHEATGSPDDLAERLDVSRSTLFEIIAFLKDEMKAPIRYDRNRPSYVYNYTPKFNLGFERDRMQSDEMYLTTGGCKESPPKINKPDDDFDEDQFIFDDDFSFDELNDF